MSDMEPKAKQLKLGDKEVTVQELSLRKYKELGEVLKGLGADDFKRIAAAFDSEETDKIMGAVGELLLIVPETLAKVIQMVTGVDQETIMDAPQSQVVEVLSAAWDLNNLGDMVKKKFRGLVSSRPKSPTTVIPFIKKDKKPEDEATPPTK